MTGNLFINDEAGEEEEEWDEEDYDSYTEPYTSSVPANSIPTQTEEANGRETFEMWLGRVHDRCMQAQATNPRGTQMIMLLHRVRCQPGMEYQLSTSIQDDDECPHRAVVLPWLRCWVYFETRMHRPSINGEFLDDLETRLLQAPGVTLRQGSPMLQSVEAEDWWTHLSEDWGGIGFGISDWLRIWSGQYRGDMALVWQKLTWGYKVLVVPCHRNGTSLKQKCQGYQPEPALLAISNTSHQPSIIQAHHYVRGLHILEVPHANALTLAEPLTWKHAKMFLDSGHPLVWECDTFPPVQEWVFEPRLGVLIDEGKTCVMVGAVGAKALEITAEDGTGTCTISWRDVWKDIQVGDYVEIVGQASLGGWVDQVQGPNLTFLQRDTLPASQHNHGSSEMKLFHSHRNCVVVTQPPHSCANKVTDPERQTRLSVPWLGVEVHISKPHHRFRIPGWQPMPRLTSSLSVLVEMNRYSGANPRSTEWFAYEDILELQYADLHWGAFELWRPPVEPAPTEADTHPSAVTPLHLPSHSPLWASYWWEHLQLRNKEMRITLPDKKKDVVVKAVTFGDEVALVRIIYNQPVAVDVQRMKVRHPHQRDYDLWMVTKGQYVGCHVCGLDYEVRAPGKELWWDVIVANVVAGHVDENMGIELTLPATHLVLVPESLESRKLNDTLKRMLRKQFEEWSRR
ncbi:hypothetical protein F5146DRAFT_1135526 [Armillaria mellea]|nr:hypothetical protein F5146DRAFT_1135526 [Armillaria mellea]